MGASLLAALNRAIERREAVALVTVTQAEGALAPLLGRRGLHWPDPSADSPHPLDLSPLPPAEASPIHGAIRQAIEGKQHRQLTVPTSLGALGLFVEVQRRPPHLIIVGAGHIAVPLASIASTCDFLVTVLDDRPQYAHPARFPTADRVIAGEFRQELQKLRQGKPHFDSDTYIVLVTRGHQYDVACLLEVLDDPLAYIGMIGSKRRIRAVYELLEREEGIAPAKLSRVHAPIGLDIGAITPAEIGVCIMAEIINTLRGGPAQGISAQIRQERADRLARLAR